MMVILYQKIIQKISMFKLTCEKYGHDCRVALLSESYLVQELICKVWNKWTDPNYRKAMLKKIFWIFILIFRQEGDEISLNTETTFRTTETKFRLNETWKEDTAGM